MAGIMAAMKPFSSLGTAFSNNPALKAVQQAQQRAQAQAASQPAGVAGAASVSAAPPAPSATDTSGLEARIAALEVGGSNTEESIVQAATPPPSTPSSMAPGALAVGEAMFGNQEQRDMAVDPNIFNRRFN